MNTISELILAFFIAITFVAVLALLMALPTMWLWNWALVPAVDGINSIGFIQALGLNFLFSILFKPTTNTSKK